MKNTVRALALFLALQPALVAAQVPNTPQTLPANTVVGRLGVTPGPAQAIPFSRFQSAVSGPCATASAGLVPATGGGTTNYLRADCTFAPPLPSIANNNLLANTSGGSAVPAAKTPASLWDSFCSTTIGNIWVRQTGGWGCLALGYANPVWWGADPTGAADSASAFNSAFATNLPVRWPPGTFKMNSQVAVTLATATSCFCMHGAGQGLTILNWPNASGGIQVTGGAFTLVQITNVTLTTSQNGGGNGIKLINGATSTSAPASSILDVTIQGADATSTGLNYWNVGFYDHNWSNVVVDRVNINGDIGHSLQTQNSTGIQIEGDGTNYVQSIKISHSWFGGKYGLYLGSYWQGLFCHHCNIGANQGVYLPGSQTGTLVQLTITDSIFYATYDAVELNSGTTGVQLLGNNVFLAVSTGAGGLIMGTAAGATIVGNVITGSGGSANAISHGGTYSTIVGNYFQTYAAGVVLQAASNNNTVGLNTYFSNVTTKVSNLGASNSVGTAAAGNMTGVVP